MIHIFMKRQPLIFFSLLAAILFIAARNPVHPERVRLYMHSQSLHHGKLTETEADLYYQVKDKRLITKYNLPFEQVMITNDKGEVSIFNPKQNTVYRSRQLEYSTQNNLIYYFLSGNVRDLGLRDSGFQQSDTRFEDGLMIATWIPPASMSQLFSHVELVHEHQLPVYAAYYNAAGELIKKVYYDGYENIKEMVLPANVTSFDYLPGGDSIVQRVRFSHVEVNPTRFGSMFEFEIPENARIVSE